MRRAEAAAFARLVGGSAGFRAQQQTWFDNLTQLPVERLGYKVERTGVRTLPGYDGSLLLEHATAIR